MHALSLALLFVYYQKKKKNDKISLDVKLFFTHPQPVSIEPRPTFDGTGLSLLVFFGQQTMAGQLDRVVRALHEFAIAPSPLFHCLHFFRIILPDPRAPDRRMRLEKSTIEKIPVLHWTAWKCTGTRKYVPAVRPQTLPHVRPVLVRAFRLLVSRKCETLFVRCQTLLETERTVVKIHEVTRCTCGIPSTVAAGSLQFGFVDAV